MANNNGEGRAYTRVYYSDWRQGEWIRLEGNHEFHRRVYLDPHTYVTVLGGGGGGGGNTGRPVEHSSRRKPVEILKLTLKRKEPREYK